MLLVSFVIVVVVVGVEMNTTTTESCTRWYISLVVPYLTRPVLIPKSSRQHKIDDYYQMLKCGGGEKNVAIIDLNREF